MVSAIPNIPGGMSRKSSEVKSATPDIIIEDINSVPIELIERLIFESLGGQELLLLSRHDTVRGQEISYRPISNSRDIDFRYSSETILFATESFKNYFKNFSIFLESVVPELDGNQYSPNAYVEVASGDIILEFKDVRPEQQIESQTLSNASVFDDTIY
jgi:hypothetical protein